MKILRVVVCVVFMISIHIGFFGVVHAQTPPQPPASLTQPPICRDDGWSAAFQWEKSPTAEVTDYVLRVNYSDFPSPLWLVFDGTDIWKRHAGEPQTPTTAAMVRNIFPSSVYADWSVQSVIGDDTAANDARMAKSTQSFFCTPKRDPNPDNCTTACEPSVGVWKEEFKYESSYKSQDLNDDGKIDLVDFELIRQFKNTPTNTPTPTPRSIDLVENRTGQNYTHTYTHLPVKFTGTIQEGVQCTASQMKFYTKAKTADTYTLSPTALFTMSSSNTNMFTLEDTFTTAELKDIQTVCEANGVRIAVGTEEINVFDYLTNRPSITNARIITENATSITLAWEVVNTDFDLNDYETTITKIDDATLVTTTPLLATRLTYVISDIACGNDQLYKVWITRKGYPTLKMGSAYIPYTKTCATTYRHSPLTEFKREIQQVLLSKI